MKTISQIKANEVIEHKGDLTIEGDIGPSAKVIVINGSLIVNGNISMGAKITVRTLNETRSLEERIHSAISEIGPSTHSVALYSIQDSEPNAVISLDLSLLPDIDFADNDFTLPSSKQIKQDIKPKPTPTLNIAGVILNNVTIDSDVAIKAKVIGDNCNIKSVYKGLYAVSVGTGTTISAEEINVIEKCGNQVIMIAQSVNLNEVGDEANISSGKGGASIKIIGRNANVQARDKGAIVIKHCTDPSSLKVTSDGYVCTPIPQQVSPFSLTCISHEEASEKLQSSMSIFVSSAAIDRKKTPEETCTMQNLI